MKNGFGSAALILCLGLAGGCSKAPSDNDAIRVAIEKHLSDHGGLNMAAMDMSVKQVSINGDQAQARVEFRLKQGGGGMQVAYTLQRVQGAWVLGHSQPVGGEISHPPIEKQPAGASGTTATQPPGTPPGGSSPDFPSLDKFKKPGPEQAPGTPPPGHPPVAKPASAPQ